jgi:hypothetical protein
MAKRSTKLIEGWVTESRLTKVTIGSMGTVSPFLFDSPEAAETLKRLVMNSVDSPESRRLYGRAVDKFVRWIQGDGLSASFNRGTVQAFKAHLIETGLSSSGVNRHSASST